MRKFVFVVLIVLFYSIAYTIEVGGHLTEDTTWSPVENPYLVTETLYVDAGVTLTILPETEIKVSGASLTNSYEYTQNFWLYNGVSIAKFIQVDGRIIAEGTAQDSIIFTRMQDDPNYNWGSICITIDAELCIFKFCVFEHMGNTGLAISNISEGLDFFNGRGRVQNCKFLNCTVGINSDSYEKELEIINSEFIIDDGVNPYLPNFNYGKNFIMSSRIGTYEAKDVLICNNVFEGYDAYHGFSVEQMSFAFNKITECVSSGGANYFYSNEFIDCTTSINGYNYDSLYVKKNRFIGGSDGIDLDYAYVDISNNYFEDCGIDTDLNCYGNVTNNLLQNSSLHTASYLEICNNISFNGNTGMVVTYRNEMNSNNISYDNQYAFGGYYNGYYNNCILLSNEELTQYGVSGNPIFRNCIIDFPLDPPLIDGGGNIIVDSIQAQQIFENIQNGDFHLIEGSLAIDAGFDTLGYYYPFDMDYNHRVWDGDNNGTAIIDIGPYEYGAPTLGAIQGVTYNPSTGDLVDYVLLKIDNQPGEFTFTDSIGNFEYKLPAGIYDIYAERVFFEDVIEYQVEVIDGQFTQLDIPMFETVDVEENEIVPINNDFNLINYPNPFNPQTSISFNLHEEGEIQLDVFNIKGQKIKSLLSDQIKAGEHSVIWNGNNQYNQPVSSGIYLYKLNVDGRTETVKKCLLLK